MKNQVEIERKYIIKMPKISDMEKMCGYSADEITQIYLESEVGETRRIRKRSSSLGIVYTETRKIRIDKMSAIEKEREISEVEFSILERQIADGTAPIKKVRHSFEEGGQIFEIDVYPEWKNTAIMETELPTRETAVEIPSIIEIVEEVTGKREYSNAAMSRSFPKERL